MNRVAVHGDTRRTSAVHTSLRTIYYYTRIHRFPGVQCSTRPAGVSPNEPLDLLREDQLSYE